MDPIADMLNRIRNAGQALLPEVELPHSKIKEGIARILKDEGYISDCSVVEKPYRTLKLKLKYQNRRSVIESLRRMSTPGLRRYVSAGEIPRVLGGLGISIMSTSKGIMSGTTARKGHLGGELICIVW